MNLNHPGYRPGPPPHPAPVAAPLTRPLTMGARATLGFLALWGILSSAGWLYYGIALKHTETQVECVPFGRSAQICWRTDVKPVVPVQPTPKDHI